MQQTQAAVIAALTFVCLLNCETVSAGPATSRIEKGFATRNLENGTDDKTSNSSSEKSCGDGNLKPSASVAEKNVENNIGSGNEKASASFEKSPASAQKDLKGETENWRRLKGGDVIVDSDEKGDNRFVVARILIAETPVKVWRILTNPFEFQGKISPRMKDVEILEDTAERSVMKCKMEVLPPLIPFISYTVVSDYKLHEHIQFRRVAGSLKDFSGTWDLASREDGRATIVTYAMHVDPGLPVPQWIVRKAMRMELPRTLIALRDRVISSDATIASAEPIKTILAVGPSEPTIGLQKLPPQATFVQQKHFIKSKTASKPKLSAS